MTPRLTIDERSCLNIYDVFDYRRRHFLSLVIFFLTTDPRMENADSVSSVYRLIGILAIKHFYQLNL